MFFSIPIFFEQPHKSKEELRQEVEWSNYINYLEHKKEARKDLEKYNQLHNKNYTFKEALESGMFNSIHITQKHLEEIMSDTYGI